MKAVKIKRRLARVSKTPKTNMLEGHIQDHNAKHNRSRTKLAFSGAAVFPVVASALAAVSSPGVLVALVFIRILIFTLSFRFTLSDVRRHTNPSGKPENRIQTVDARKGIDIAESTGSGPNRDSDKVDQTGNTKPALHRPSISIKYKPEDIRKAHQCPIPGRSPVNTITLGPDRNGENPRQEDEHGL